MFMKIYKKNIYFKYYLIKLQIRLYSLNAIEGTSKCLIDILIFVKVNNATLTFKIGIEIFLNVDNFIVILILSV